MTKCTIFAPIRVANIWVSTDISSIFLRCLPTFKLPRVTLIHSVLAASLFEYLFNRHSILMRVLTVTADFLKLVCCELNTDLIPTGLLKRLGSNGHQVYRKCILFAGSQLFYSTFSILDFISPLKTV